MRVEKYKDVYVVGVQRVVVVVNVGFGGPNMVFGEVYTKTTGTERAKQAKRRQRQQSKAMSSFCGTDVLASQGLGASRVVGGGSR